MSSAPNLSATLGPEYLGVVLATWLYGITVLQAYSFLISVRRTSDRWYTYLFVTAIVVLDTVQQALLITGLYLLLVYGSSGNGILLLVVHGYFGATTIAAVRIFFGMRVWSVASTIKSSFRYALLGLIVALATCYFIAACFYITDSLKIQTGQGRGVLGRDRIQTSTFAITGDVLICVSLTWMLRKFRKGFSSLDSIVKTILLFTIHTGLLFTVLNILALITVYQLPKTLVFVVFGYTEAKVYVNSALASLNYRDTMNDRMERKNTDCTCGKSIGMEFARSPRRTFDIPSSASISFDVDPSQDADRPKSFNLKSAGSVALAPLAPIHEDGHEFEVTRMTV